MDMASFAKTQADWRHTDEGHQCDNLFARGSDRCSIVTHNFTVRKILSPRNQRAVASVCEVNMDETKLGRFC